MNTKVQQQTEYADPRPEPIDMPVEEQINTPLVPANPAVQAPVQGEIVTAQQVKVFRDEARILQKLRVRAAMAGEDWFYRYPVKDGGKTSYVEGPSIKAANNVVQLFGNCRVDTHVVDNLDSWIIYARFIDYETGLTMVRPWQQSKGQKTIKTKNNDRAESIAFQIGVSKAIRNVVCNALDAFTNFAFEEAKKSLVSKIGNQLPQTIEKIKNRLETMKVDVKAVEAAVGRPIAAWLAADAARVIAEIQSVQDGMATADETWPSAKPEPTRADVADAKKAADTKPASDPAPKQNEQAKEPEKESWVMVNSDGEVEDEADNPRDFAIAFINMATKAPSRRGEMAEINKDSLAKALAILDQGDAAHKAVANDLRPLLATGDAPAAEPEKKDEAPVDTGPKPMVLPKNGNKINAPAYIKAINEECGICPDADAVRALWKREQPNLELIGPQYVSAINLRFKKRLAEFGVDQAL